MNTPTSQDEFRAFRIELDVNSSTENLEGLRLIFNRRSLNNMIGVEIESVYSILSSDDIELLSVLNSTFNNQVFFY
ncbi:MAG: hypothetical protein R2764_12835 [Bacteroidales bacterium]